ncbi:response regulator [Desulfobulbus sp.]|uniref:response regulator n=1 Tax=Desulfobulbus sp. TaxID=895 RepID=UPI0027B98B45|nr:response regulator [Desulfobulbus sp.]
MPQPIKVLIIDREPEFASILTERLHSWGFAASAAHGKEEALDALVDFDPKVVVLGLQDKDSGGLELLSMIKAFNPAIEVLLLIGKGMAIAGMQGIERGAFDYIPQPIELGVLIGKIRKAAGVEADQ